MTAEEIDRLLDYRNAGNFVNSDIEFQKVTGISDSLLREISVFFRFPEWVKKNKLPGKATQNALALTGMSDLNTAGVDQLTRVQGMELKIARRIVAYRKLLKGYSMNDQLYEVYGISRELAERVLIHFSVLDRPSIEKLNLNEADFKSILHTPYLDYKLTKKIFEFKDRNGIFQSVEDLKKIDSFPLEKFDRIALYLTAE
jgi:DNA uptake protein ComE-like DNA-binding protein